MSSDFWDFMCEISFFCISFLPTVQKTCIFWSSGDFKLPLDVSVGVNSVCMCPVMNCKPVQGVFPAGEMMDG